MAFDRFLAGQGRGLAVGRRRWGMAAAIAAHAVLIGVAVVHEFWQVDEVPPPARIVMAPVSFRLPELGGGSAGAPQQKSEFPNQVRPPRPPRPTDRPVVQPAPAEVIPPSQDEPATVSGQPDGEGPVGSDGSGGQGQGRGRGRRGGDEIGPVDGSPSLVPPDVGAKRCVNCPNPLLPAAVLKVSLGQSVVAKICVGSDGAVQRVSILRGIVPGADAAVADTVRTWRFSPATVQGRAVPFCYVARFVFAGG